MGVGTAAGTVAAGLDAGTSAAVFVGVGAGTTAAVFVAEGRLAGDGLSN
jgi:hypothetical protein